MSMKADRKYKVVVEIPIMHTPEEGMEMIREVMEMVGFTVVKVSEIKPLGPVSCPNMCGQCDACKAAGV